MRVCSTHRKKRTIEHEFSLPPSTRTIGAAVAVASVLPLLTRKLQAQRFQAEKGGREDGRYDEKKTRDEECEMGEASRQGRLRGRKR